HRAVRIFSWATHKMNRGGKCGGIHRTQPTLTFGVDWPISHHNPTSIDHCLQHCFPSLGCLVREHYHANSRRNCDSPALRQRFDHQPLKILTSFVRIELVTFCELNYFHLLWCSWLFEKSLV